MDCMDCDFTDLKPTPNLTLAGYQKSPGSSLISVELRRFAVFG